MLLPLCLLITTLSYTRLHLLYCVQLFFLDLLRFIINTNTLSALPNVSKVLSSSGAHLCDLFGDLRKSRTQSHLAYAHPVRTVTHLIVFYECCSAVESVVVPKSTLSAFLSAF